MSDLVIRIHNAAAINFQDESAIEVYYNWAVKPWLRPGANIQYVNPAGGDYDNALVSSLRARFRF